MPVVRHVSHAVRFIVANHETLVAPHEIHPKTGEEGIVGTSRRHIIHGGSLFHQSHRGLHWRKNCSVNLGR
jgi:hypothetical protein